MQHPKAKEEARIDFQERIKGYENEGKTIVYLDESGFAQDRPRTHGYSTQGKRCYGIHGWNAKGRINAIGAIIGFAFVSVSLFDMNINSDVFCAWLKQDLLPKIYRGAVIVMDNASFHKRQDILKAISEHECIIEFLPPYSPDLNPIEHKWAHVKGIRQKHRCDVDELFSIHSNYAAL